jgi:hypothetical protein
VATAPVALAAVVVMLAGAVNTGAASRTVTVNVWVVVRLDELVDVHVTVVMPMGKVDPDAGKQLTGSVPSLKSVAVGVA